MHHSQSQEKRWPYRIGISGADESEGATSIQNLLAVGLGTWVRCAVRGARVAGPAGCVLCHVSLSFLRQAPKGRN